MRIDRGMAAVNGARLAYEVAGDGPAVVFVHGFTLDRRMWDDQMPAFAARHRVVRYDLRGFGASSPPAIGEPYTHADDLYALLKHLGIARAAVVGLSMGGWVAQDFALAHPAALRALVLVDSYGRRYPFGPGFVGTLERLYRLGRKGRLDEAKAGWLADPLFAASRRNPAVAARLERIVADYPGWHLRHDDPHRPQVPPAIERLHEIAAPTLVVVGADDLSDFRAVADLLAARIPGARQLVLPEAGHMANMDAPGAFNRAVLAFLQTVELSRLGGRAGV